MGTPGAVELTVAKARALPDDTYVILTGKLIKKTGDDEYIFRDASGEIRVEIDEDLFHGLAVSPEDTVRLTGEIDNEGASVDVKRMTVLSR